jgi:hypothetical protein
MGEIRGKTNFYVDGFNLYYGCAKDTDLKWLNLGILFHVLYPKNEINRIRYFTALVDDSPNDPRKTRRQLTYVRALETIPNLTVHYGQFMSNTVKMPRADNPKELVEVIRTEEKGSDVNLASYLLRDGYAGDYEVAIVVSSDSDLVEPIKIVKEELKLPVGVINPSPDKKRRSSKLFQIATFKKRIRKNALEVCQFPMVMKDVNGAFTKPVEWFTEEEQQAYER